LLVVCLLDSQIEDELIPETFDIRVEVQAPVNGTEAYNGGVPSPDFSVVIAGGDAEPIDITQFFSIEEPEGESCLLVSPQDQG
jgi:hypothetical protein